MATIPIDESLRRIVCVCTVWPEHWTMTIPNGSDLLIIILFFIYYFPENGVATNDDAAVYFLS